MKILLPVFLFIIAAASCKSSKQNSVTKRIFGENDLVSYGKKDNISGAIGHILNASCTGFHIGNGYVITAGHCVKTNSCEDRFGGRYEIAWGFIDYPYPKAPDKSRCIEFVERVDDEKMDFAILRYDNIPNSALKVNLQRIPVIGDKLTILSHPDSQPLKSSGWCKHEGNTLESIFNFKYFCDTTGGSSGAPVFNEKYEVVGVHHGGDDPGNSAVYLKEISSLSIILNQIKKTDLP